MKCHDSRPPTIQDVKIYFNQKGMPEYEADNFYHFYEKKQWKNKTGNFYRNWKYIAYMWIASVVQNQPLLFDKWIH